MHEFVEDGYIVFNKLGRWRVPKKGLVPDGMRRSVTVAPTC